MRAAQPFLGVGEARGKNGFSPPQIFPQNLFPFFSFSPVCSEREAPAPGPRVPGSPSPLGRRVAFTRRPNVLRARSRRPRRRLFDGGGPRRSIPWGSRSVRTSRAPRPTRARPFALTAYRLPACRALYATHAHRAHTHTRKRAQTHARTFAVARAPRSKTCALATRLTHAPTYTRTQTRAHTFGVRSTRSSGSVPSSVACARRPVFCFGAQRNARAFYTTGADDNTGVQR